ncbi:carbon monoxide dehydrogenase subunit G [Donghicola sp. C2-DW-16]|uniref:Carbon monoxide dehydrogenase subunit G n=1 Tax=Donghicola mangrovi TaxID=2729614 RepID=A0ABX2PDV6_9RHOB|nr:carbon monoxide dehydrogenase subunit G [Donghicola mangrovi]
MNMNDSREIAATPEAVWAAILDPEVLRQCVPGCEEMQGSPEEGFDATVVQKVGPVKAKFSGKVTLSDMVAPQSLRLSGEGKGGAAGFAKGEATVTLAPSGAGTLLTYDVEAKVGGKLAQLGSRVIDGFAKKMADQFFENFQNVVEGDAAAEEAPAVETVATEETAVEGQPQEEKKGFFKRLFS